MMWLDCHRLHLQYVYMCLTKLTPVLQAADVFLFTRQEEFLSLCVDKLTEILASDFLNASKEEMVFEAAVLWLNKCPSRKQSFEKVRFYILI